MIKNPLLQALASPSRSFAPQAVFFFQQRYKHDKQYICPERLAIIWKQ